MNARQWTISMMVAAMAVALVAPLGGCASSGPSPDVMPEGGTYSGLWYSPQYEHMYLHQDGDRVEGVYTYRAGGTIEGTVEGNMLLFSWHQPGDRGAAQRAVNGKGYFHLISEGEEVDLVGQWGYNDDRSGAPWEAELIREIEDKDPRTLEDLERRR